MRFVRVTALAVLPSLALLTTTAHASSSCWYPNEIKAAQLRDFQTMLMVGTLQCRSKDSSIVDLYNAFITKQRGLLDSHAQILKTHFVRENGAQDGQGAYDRYATALANNNSANIETPDYCSKVDTLVRTATAATQPDLLVLAQSMSEAPVSGTCPPSSYHWAEAKTTERPGPIATAAAAPQPAVAEAPAAATAPASREDALQAAIVALQSATAALQAASASTTVAASTPEATQAQAVVVKVEDAPVVPPNETVDE